MPARDIFHHSVKTALQKDGWKITDDPLFIRCVDVELYIDWCLLNHCRENWATDSGGSKKFYSFFRAMLSTQTDRL